MPMRRSTRDSNILTDPYSTPKPSPARTRAYHTAVTPTAPKDRELSEEKSDKAGDNNNEGSINNYLGIEPFELPHRSLRLVIKMPSNRLRDATSAATKDRAPAPSGRATRNIKKSYVVETSSEDEEDEEEDEEEQEDYDDANAGIGDEATPNKLQENDEDEGIEEDEDIDAEGDLDMDDDADDGIPLGHQPPPAHTPILRMNPPAAPKTKPKVTLTPAQDTTMKSVESKEMDVDEEEDDDEELSELGSDDEVEVDDEEDAEGEIEDEEEGEEGDEEEDAEGEEIDDDEEMAEADDSRSPDLLSRGTTPDINKMTKRQRSRLNEVLTASDSVGGGGDFLELPMEPQVKKHLTAEEHAMRRAEMARRRKNLSEKRNEEEKQDTINRLLKKQAPKRRGKISAKEIEAQDRGDMSEAEEQAEEVPILPADPIFVRWVSDSKGSRVGVPVEWIGAPVGKIFGDSGNGHLVEGIQG